MRIDARLRVLLTIEVLVLLGGAWVTICYLMYTLPLVPSQPPQEEGLALMQLEAPPEEVALDGDAVLPEQGVVPEWVAHGKPESIPLLIRYLRDEDEVVQLAALAELAAMDTKAKRAVPAMVEALQDPKSSIRVQAAVTLIQMNVQARTAIRALAKELQSQDAAARAQAFAAVEALVDPPEILDYSCWGPGPPPRIARPWVRAAVAQAMK
jgi:hypothetical protein